MFSFQGFKEILTKVEKRLEDYKPSSTLLTTSLDKAKGLSSVSYSLDDLLSLESVPEAFYKQNIDLTAGLPLVEKYEVALKIIHENNANLAARAEAADKLIFPAVSRVNDQANAVIQLQKALETLPAIQTELESVKKSIQSLADDFAAVERLLDQHIIAHNETVTHQVKEKLSTDLDRYHLQQMRALASARNDALISAHQRTLDEQRAAELSAQKDLEKEQKILEDARLKLRAQEAQAKRQIDAETEKKRQEYDKMVREQLQQYRARELEIHSRLQQQLCSSSSASTDPFAVFGTSSSASSVTQEEDPFAAFGTTVNATSSLSSAKKAPLTLASLETVKLETDRTELDAFLEATPPTSNVDVKKQNS